MHRIKLHIFVNLYQFLPLNLNPEIDTGLSNGKMGCLGCSECPYFRPCIYSSSYIPELYKQEA